VKIVLYLLFHFKFFKNVGYYHS